MKKKITSFKNTKVYAVYYSKNNTIYYNTNFDSTAPKIIVKK